MDAGGGDQPPDPTLVAGERREQFEHAGIVTAHLSAQCEAEVAPDVPIVERHRARVAVREMTHERDGPRPDAGQRAQSCGNLFDVVDRRPQPVGLARQRDQRARPVEVQTDTQQVITAKSGHDLGSRRRSQRKGTRSSLAVAASEARPALTGFVGGDALPEHGVHRDLDRVGAGSEPQAGEAAHESGEALVVGRELEWAIGQAGQRDGPGQHVGGAFTPDIDHQHPALARETGARRATRGVGGKRDGVPAEHPKRGIARRHPDQAHRHCQVERSIDRELDPFVHWETSVGDSTVWVYNRKDVPMALSTSAQAVLDQLALLPAPPDFATITPAQEAEYIQASRAATAGAREGEDVAQVHNVTVDASGCAARIYVPESAVRDAGIIVHFHGGGWLTGSIEMSDDACRYLANRAGCVVMSAAYRFAPEHPFPAAADDAYAAFQWAAAHAGDYGADGTRVATIGTSAGATLAASTCLRAADGTGQQPVFQVLVYPPLDATFQSQSYIDNATGYYLTADQMRWFWAQYAGQASREDPLLSPVYANDLRRQPPALIITAEFDPLRDDGERYATQLREAGVPVELRRVEGQIHSFMGLIATVPEARECWTLVAERLRAALA